MSFKTCGDNLQKIVLIWLDPQVNKTDENRQVQQKLRQIINNLVVFDDQRKCQHHISSLPHSSSIFLIVSGQCGRELVPQIHQLSQLSRIYVYCMNKQANEQWAKNFAKV